MSVGFAVVGCGMIAEFHAQALAATRGAKLVACVSERAASAERFAAAHGCTGL